LAQDIGDGMGHGFGGGKIDNYLIVAALDVTRGFLASWNFISG
jgi:hypothetical protein